MDASAKLLNTLPHLFPKRQRLEGIDGQMEGDLRPYFFSSVRYLSVKGVDMLLIHAMDLVTKEKVQMRVDGLSFFVWVPQEHVESVARVTAQYGPALSHPFRVFDGDRKKWMDTSMVVFNSLGIAKDYVSRVNSMLKDKDSLCYTFGDMVDHQDGNTVTLSNGLLCSHVYYAPHPSTKDGGRYLPRDFVWDSQRDTDHSVNLPEIVRYCKREGSFDIETIVKDQNKDQDLLCPRFESRYLGSLRDNASLAATITEDMPYLGLPQAPYNNSIVHQLHEITSVALVVNNKHLDKKEGSHRKELMVYYNSKRVAEPLKEVEMAHLGLDRERVNFVACPSEVTLLLKFVTKIKNSVDVLYVYNAQFDLKVIEQRLAYYAFAGRGGNCCPCHSSQVSLAHGEELLHRWNEFLSKRYPLYKGKLTLGCDLMQEAYEKLLAQIHRLIKNPALTKESREGVARSLVAQYQKNKINVQNFKSSGFQCDVVDMLYVTKRREFESKDGTLNTKASIIIRKFRPGKNPLKSRKLKDVTYDKLDEYFLSGGTKLAECLVYNLIDAQLVTRMARYIRPVEEYIYRQVASYSVDVACHTRGMVDFSGFIQSTRLSEVSRAKARLDQSIVMGADYNRKHNPLMYTPETCPRRGGFVMAPMTGLSFARPGQSSEVCLDFSSLYPSIMCDLNISPETIIDKGNEGLTPDYVGYDWSSIPEGFDKHTLVLTVDRSDPSAPRLKRHFSDTSVSLKRYLSLRNHHKRMNKKAQGLLEAEYHERLQLEMKVCANIHYGTCDYTCSLMITTQGQHKIKLVNKVVGELNRALRINYGDTDSTMFFTPPDPLEGELSQWLKPGEEGPKGPGVDPQLRDLVLKKMSSRAVDYILAKFKHADRFLEQFLEEVDRRVVEDMLANMGLFDAEGNRHPSWKCPERDRWYLTDPVTGLELDLEGPFKEGLICKLEYENAASIGCHFAKKMYLSLIHEVSGGKITCTKLKRRGLMGFKSSRFGATETVTVDFEDLIYKGHALTRKDDELVGMRPSPWSALVKGDVFYYLSHDGVSLVPYSVERAWSEPQGSDAGIAKLEFLYVDCVREKTVGPRKVSTLVLTLAGGYVLNHMYSSANVLLRELCYEQLAYARAFSVASGFLDWNDMVHYEKTSKLKKEFLDNIANYNLLSGKRLKLAYVTLLKGKTELMGVTRVKKSAIKWPKEWVKQDPCMSLFRHYPVDLRPEVMFRDYVGDDFLCENRGWTKPQHTKAALWWPEGGQLALKNEVCSTYLNAQTKFLIHVVMDRTAHSTLAGDPASLVTEMVGAASRSKTELHGVARRGLNLFREFFRTLPPDLDLTKGCSDYRYDERLDTTIQQKISLPRLHSHAGKPEVIYARVLERIRELLVLARKSDMVTHEARGGCRDVRTLCLILPQLAIDLGVEETPVLRLVTDETGDRTLVSLAESLYQATLMLHYMYGTRLQAQPHMPCEDGQLVEPPLRATPWEMEEWLRGMGKVLSGQVVAHCPGCLLFWEQASLDNGGLGSFLEKHYFFDPNEGAFNRLQQIVCTM